MKKTTSSQTTPNSNKPQTKSRQIKDTLNTFFLTTPAKTLRLIGGTASVILLLIGLISLFAAQDRSDRGESLARVNSAIDAVTPEVADRRAVEDQLFYETGFSEEYFQAANETSEKALELGRLKEAKAELEASSFKVPAISVILIVLAFFPFLISFYLPTYLTKKQNQLV